MEIPHFYSRKLVKSEIEYLHDPELKKKSGFLKIALLLHIAHDSENVARIIVRALVGSLYPRL